jgi:hypothetical protein
MNQNFPGQLWSKAQELSRNEQLFTTEAGKFWGATSLREKKKA